MSSWDWFTTHFANFKLEVDHPKGYEEYRHGGFDRLLVPYDGTPTLDEIVNDGIRAPWILQETVQVAPLQSQGYLAAVSEAGEKLRAAERGIRLHGAYNVMLRNDSEVVVQWAFDELPTWVETVEHPDAVPELRAWRERAAGLERSHAGVLLRPTEWSPLH
jgi:hypothetical protein